MIQLARRLSRGTRGQALVEFALMVPAALILIMAVWEIGRAWNAYQVMTDAAREGARVAVVANAQVGIPVDSVYNTVNLRLVTAAMDSTSDNTTVTGFNAGVGQPATVAITYPYQFTFLGALLQWTTGDKNITLSTSFSMRNE